MLNSPELNCPRKRALIHAIGEHETDADFRIVVKKDVDQCRQLCQVEAVRGRDTQAPTGDTRTTLELGARDVDLLTVALDSASCSAAREKLPDDATSPKVRRSSKLSTTFSFAAGSRSRDKLTFAVALFLERQG